jgi:uncharacterized protein YfaS (alpha-2-macroglobulin family)
MAAVFVIAAVVMIETFQDAEAAPIETPEAVYAHGTLRITIPYKAEHAGDGRLTMEVLDPEDKVEGSLERRTDAIEGKGRWNEELKLDKPLALDDLIWHRVHYRFEYTDSNDAPLEGTESISQILRTPVVHILGQQAYLTGVDAAVRVIATDSHNELIGGPGSVRIELMPNAAAPDNRSSDQQGEQPGKPNAAPCGANANCVWPAGNTRPFVLYTGRLNQRGTTEAQLRFPKGLAPGSYQLHYAVDTAIGATDYTQSVRVEDKISILLTTEKPIYQPGQTIHVRALALDRADHEAAGNRGLTFEVEDSRGNKVFKKQTQTDKFGVASAEFALADEVNLGTYHLRALMGDADAPTNRAEIALNVDKYVLPKFKVAIDFGGADAKSRRGYRPGDHVTGTVQANYFFGKPVEGGEVTVKGSGMDVSMFEVGSVHGKTDHDGTYHFDLKLPEYFAGRPLSQGAARVLIEATVKDSASHTESRGEPVTVSESPLVITAVPEGGALVPNLENQVFVLASYPDGTPAPGVQLKVTTTGNSTQNATTDDGGVAVVAINAGSGARALDVDATDQEGNRASSKVELESRTGDDQILLRTERAVYRPGDRIQLKVFSTKKRGTAYIDIVKDGQTMFTRDVDFEDGHAELAITATAAMAGTVDFNAYLFGSNAIPVADHRFVFVQPADELKIETVADNKVYKPGDEAHVSFRITNGRGEGVSAVLGLEVVDEAVFALAEKQPGFAKVFFYLEQEVMKPRYEIHSIGMPEVVGTPEEGIEKSKVERRDRAARALFSATEMVNDNKFQTEFGRSLPMAKYAEYAKRYQQQFVVEARRLAEDLSLKSSQNPGDDLVKVADKMVRGGDRKLRDPWNNNLRIEPLPWYPQKTHYVLRSAGPDKQFNTGDDMAVYLQVEQRKMVRNASSGANAIDVNIEHERGPFNRRGEIFGTAVDQWGLALEGATVKVRDLGTQKIRSAQVNAKGEFRFVALAPGDYQVEVSTSSESIANSLRLDARDRAVLSVFLRNEPTVTLATVNESVSVSGVTETIEVEAAATGAAFDRDRIEALPMNGRNMVQFAALAPGLARKKEDDAKATRQAMAVDSATAPAPPEAQGESAPRVRSYFPEALYINPEIITDKDGRASIVIPMADSITTWRMAMLASTVHGALGSATSSLKVFQDFFVDLDLPVTLTQGDRVSIPVAIYNYAGGKGDVSLELQPDDWYSLVDDSGEKSATVQSGSVGGSQFTIEARRIGKFKLTLSARMKGSAERADIVVREIEVIPNGREQNLVFNGRLENTVEHEVNFPAGSIPEASKIFVRLYPGPLSQVIEGMDSILRMPGGCFEQTSSSTYPNILALDYMKRTGKLTPEVHAKAEGYIANGYQRLLTFEVPGGGFSWFGQAPANKILTAYGLMEFYDMSKVYDVDPKVIGRTQQWLAGQQQADGSWKPDTYFINEGATTRYNTDVLRITAYIAWSLENTGYQGPAVDKAKEYVTKQMNAGLTSGAKGSGKPDAYTLAVLANFATDYGKDRGFTSQGLQLLLDARTEKDDKVWWSTEETSVYATGESADVETTGLAVQALLKWGEASGTARKALTYLASKKDAAGTWGTTQATIMALRALLLATDKSAADVRGTVEVLLNGKPVEKLVLTRENNDLLHQFVFKELDAKGGNDVEIRFDGKGGLAYQVVGKYFVPWDEKPAGEALSIDVAYDRTHLAQDDIATATATVRNNLDKTANMVMVDLGIPPGFDLLSEDLESYQEKTAGMKSGKLEKFSQTATQAILYFNSFAPGETVKVSFRLRAKYPIRARTFRSRVYEYYDPQVSSVARPTQLEVRQR